MSECAEWRGAVVVLCAVVAVLVVRLWRRQPPSGPIATFNLAELSAFSSAERGTACLLSDASSETADTGVSLITNDNG